MAIESNPNKSLDIYQAFIQIKRQWNREVALKSFLSLASLIAGIAVIIFLGSNYLAIGIGVIVISGMALYQYLNCHRHSMNLLARAVAAIRMDIVQVFN